MMEMKDKPVQYKTIDPAKAYKLLNTGALVIVSTVSNGNIPNLAPIAWQCPLNYDPVTRVLLVCSSEHKTLKNILQSKKFAVCLPHASHAGLVKDTGSCSGNEINKFDRFSIRTFLSEKFHLQIPDGSIGYLECEQYKIIEEDDVTIVFGKVIYAAANEHAFTNRLLSEKPEGKTLHHLGGKVFIIPGDKIIK